MSHWKAEVAVVHSLAEVSEAFMEIATALRSLPQVQTVSQPCSMHLEERVAEDQYLVGRGEGLRVEWYAEGEFVGGRAVSFCLELSWHDGEWVVEASVRANDAQGEYLLLELPRRYATEPGDLVSELQSQTRLLLEGRDEGISLFLGP